MQSRHVARKGSCALFLLPFALILAGCGSGRDAMEKRLVSLQDEVTHLQNSNDRLAERLQAIEIQGINARKQPEKAGVEPEDTRVVRPELRVVKVAPGGGGGEEAAAPEPEAAAEDGTPRPVLRDYGKPPAPAWAVPRARGAAMGQTGSGAPVRKNPQGT
jgi:hypothetical protein